LGASGEKRGQKRHSAPLRGQLKGEVRKRIEKGLVSERKENQEKTPTLREGAESYWKKNIVRYEKKGMSLGERPKL